VFRSCDLCSFRSKSCTRMSICLVIQYAIMAYITFGLSGVLDSSIDVVAWTCWVLDKPDISRRNSRHDALTYLST
jgi:hypothetical protein